MDTFICDLPNVELIDGTFAQKGYIVLADMGGLKLAARLMIYPGKVLVNDTKAIAVHLGVRYRCVLSGPRGDFANFKEIYGISGLKSRKRDAGVHLSGVVGFPVSSIRNTPQMFKAKVTEKNLCETLAKNVIDTLAQKNITPQIGLSTLTEFFRFQLDQEIPDIEVDSTDYPTTMTPVEADEEIA